MHMSESKKGKAISNDQIAEMVRRRTEREQSGKQEQARQADQTEQRRRLAESLRGKKPPGKSLSSLRKKYSKGKK